LSNNEALEREHKAQIRKEVEDRKHMKNLVQFQRDKLEYKAHQTTVYPSQVLKPLLIV
jgi:hypothetical protein